MQVVSSGFEDALRVLTTVLKPICDVIQEFANWFSSIADGLKSVTHVFNDIQNVVDKVEDVRQLKWPPMTHLASNWQLTSSACK